MNNNQNKNKIMKENPSAWDYREVEERAQKLKEVGIVREEPDQADPTELFKQSLDPERKSENLDSNELVKQDQMEELQALQKMVEEMPDKIAKGKGDWQTYFEYAQKLDQLKGITGAKNG